jgi:hypothetical protein
VADRFSFTIDRSKWFRGGKPEDSRLLRDDGKQCCVGFYLEACGVPRKHLLRANYFPRDTTPTVPAGADWLMVSRDAGEASVYVVNDAPGYSEEKRESLLTKLFADQGIDVTFVDGAVSP